MHRVPFTHIAPRPSVNYSDAPETSLMGGSGPLSRRMCSSDALSEVLVKKPCHGKVKKFRVKSLALPMLREDDYDVPSLLAEVPETSTVYSAEQPSLPWFCRTCTFKNHGELPRCEMCDAPAEDALVEDTPTDASWEHVSVSPAYAVQEGDWPSLEEAIHSFVKCETASVGSSWVDIDEVGGHAEDGDDVVLVAGQKQPSPPSWAGRAKSIATQGPVAAIPFAGVATPPLRRAVTRKLDQFTKDEEYDLWDDEDKFDNWDLDSLASRRLGTRPQDRQRSPERQSAQRHRHRAVLNACKK